MSEEQKQRAFDIVRAGFYLIASILWFQMFIVFFVMVACTYVLSSGIQLQTGQCADPQGSLRDILTGGLAAALAFVGGRSIPSGPDKKE